MSGKERPESPPPETVPEPRFHEGVTQFDIPTETDLKDIVDKYVAGLEKILVRLGWDENEAYWIGFAFNEAIQNAIIHGNLGLQKEDLGDQFELTLKEKQQTKGAKNKKVHLRTELTPQRIQITIQDEGGKKVNLSEPTPDPAAQENLMKPSHRGGFFIERVFGKEGVTREVNDLGFKITLTKTRKTES